MGEKGQGAIVMLKTIKTKTTRNISQLVKIAAVKTLSQFFAYKIVAFFLTISGQMDVKLFACFPRPC